MFKNMKNLVFIGSPQKSPETVVQGYYVKNLKKSQENTWAAVSFSLSSLKNTKEVVQRCSLETF